jgi:hypothetical protein
MARADRVGFFWDDTPPPKPEKAEKAKRTPPEATWLRPDYLPGLEEARRFPVHVMSHEELVLAAVNHEELVVDTEVYKNYFLAMFTSLVTGHVFYVEEIAGGPRLDANMLGWVLSNFKTIGFNSLNYDMTVCYLAVAGCTTEQIKAASDKMILEEIRPYEILREYKVKSFKVDHIDLIEIAPLFESLKGYGARMHVPKLQDLPFHPNTILNEDQIVCTRWYCVNDTVITAFLKVHLQEHIDLRIQFGDQYGQDFRSRSDAQMAQEVINQEIKKVIGTLPPRPARGESVGKQFYYRPPAYIQFQTPELQHALWEMSNALITVGLTGHAECPPAIRDRTVVIAGKPYKVGMGGLHSQEKCQAVVGSAKLRVIDRDVTGYYPNLILKNGFAPPKLGHAFLAALQAMVNRRTNAKREMQRIEAAGGPFDQHYKEIKAEADGLKIANNGVFGKLSDPFSTIYDVPNMVQVTITGQLSLLMAIEALELASIPVVSANTDGIVVACPADKYDLMVAIFKAWEQHTGLETEETEYKALYAASVNNYIAVTTSGKTKAKGWYTEKGSAHNSILSKNPEHLICADAVKAYLSKGTPITQTIRECKDIRRFVVVRSVAGGGVKVWDRLPPPAHETEEELIRMAGFVEIAKDAWIVEGASATTARYGKDAYKVAVDVLSLPGKTDYLGKKIRWYYAQDIGGEIVYAKNGNKVPRSEGAKPCMNLPTVLPDDIDYEWYENKAFAILQDIGAVPKAA